VGGFPSDLLVHPSLGVAFVTSTGHEQRSLQVVEIATGSVVQEIEREDSFFGLALDIVGGRLYASGGASGQVERYEVGDDGLLTEAGTYAVPDYPAGLALSADGSRLYVARFLGDAIDVLDTATGTRVGEPILLPFDPYGLALIEPRDELYATGFRSDEVGVIDLQSMGVEVPYLLPSNPEVVVASADGSRVYVSVPDTDRVVAIDTASREVVAEARFGEGSLVDEEGALLAATSPTGLLLAGDRLYVARSADNAVAVLDAASLDILGSLPVGWYPTAIGLDPGTDTLVVANGKGVGSGPSEGDGSAKYEMTGTLTLLDRAAVEADLALASWQVEDNVRRPDTVYPFTCEGTFPVPTQVGGDTPIEHVVLVVRENKTYDCLLSDLDSGERDPNFLLFGESITPNLHALVRRFAHHDNFYNDSETSAQGHLWLTSSFVNDYSERTIIEDYRGNGSFSADPARPVGEPDFGTFFTHLLKHGVPFRNYGEIVGSLGRHGEESVLDSTDTHYPGGFFNLDVPDEERAEYLVEQLGRPGNFPSFVFVLFPRDHTYGTSSGRPTPESMVNDNDRATGLLIDGLSRLPTWESTVVFVVEDDPQQGADHIDAHRSIALVASPWVKRGHTSHVHTSFPSIFRTMELILGLPPMNRYDALATPMWDAFTNTPDMEPFTALPRSVPDGTNPSGARGQEESDKMDFSGPDRNPLLGDVIWWHRKGSIRPGSPLDRVRRGEVRLEDLRDDEDED
jgi:DNA-binding beta-propeller fold protein YncE